MIIHLVKYKPDILGGYWESSNKHSDLVQARQVALQAMEHLPGLIHSAYILTDDYCPVEMYARPPERN